MIGQTVSHFKITAKLGEGGMGAVYRAEDSRLDREVAIKVLPEAFTADAERLARFEREAKVLASLNHPKIAGIYDLATADDTHFLVLELVEGESLFDRLKRGPIPLDEALPLALQIIEALDAAHSRGIVHRDLKPANVMVTKDGAIKVLDFGLAKAWEQNEASPDITHSPTLTAQMTRAGVILGTAAYMAPEQARGEEADQRSDVWSFGVVLFEMLTGQRLFSEPTVSDTLAAVLRADLDLSELHTETPASVRRTLRRCLARDPGQRLHAIADARLDLFEEEEAPSSEASEPGRKSFGLSVVLGIAAAALAAGIFLAPRFVRDTGTSSGSNAGSPVHLSVQIPPELEVFLQALGLSPDGTVVSFLARPRGPSSEGAATKLYTRALGSYEVREVEGFPADVNQWAFSPDSRWLAVRHRIAAGSADWRLSRVPLDRSAPPLALADWKDDWDGGLLWLPDGDVVTLGGSPQEQKIFRIPTDGGSPREVGAIDFGDEEGFFQLPFLLSSVFPDGNHVLGRFFEYSERGFEESIGVVDLGTGKGRILLEDAGHGQISATGHLVFSRGDGLLAVELDVDKVETVGAPFSIFTGMRSGALWDNAYFNLAANGTLLYQPGGLVGGSRRLVFADEHFEVLEPLSEDRRAFESLVSSPDGLRFAVLIPDDSGLFEVWISEVSRPRLSLFVHEAGKDCHPLRWTPDSARLIYNCVTESSRTTAIRAVDGVEADEILLEGDGTESYGVDSFLADDSTLVMTRQVAGKRDLVLLPLAAGEGGEPEPTLLITDACCGRVSPDGRWIAYVSETTGRAEVYLRRLNGDQLEGPEIPVSSEGGLGQYWHPAAAAGTLELRYLNEARDLFSAKLEGSSRAGLSESVLLANVAKQRYALGAGAVMPDGRFLFVLPGEDEEVPTHLSVVLNWLSELESHIPVR